MRSKGGSTNRPVSDGKGSTLSETIRTECICRRLWEQTVDVFTACRSQWRRET